MLFCPSFTQSERFLQTDQLIIRLQVVVVINFIRMLMRNVFVNVFQSDAVVWWAAIFCRKGDCQLTRVVGNNIYFWAYILATRRACCGTRVAVQCMSTSLIVSLRERRQFLRVTCACARGSWKLRGRVPSRVTPQKLAPGEQRHPRRCVSRTFRKCGVRLNRVRFVTAQRMAAKLPLTT